MSLNAVKGRLSVRHRRYRFEIAHWEAATPSAFASDVGEYEGDDRALVTYLW